eukprot:754186_1
MHDKLSPTHLTSPHSDSSSSSSSTIEDSPTNLSISRQQSPPVSIGILSHISSSMSDSNQSIQSTFTTQSLHNNISKFGSISHRSRTEILTCQFPQCVPKSYIVFKIINKNKQSINNITKENVLKEYKIKALQLFEKYVYNKNDQCP